MKRKFHVTLLSHHNGASVSCPEPPGCHSQGLNVDEAMENVQDAIRGYVELYGEPDAPLRNSRDGSYHGEVMPKLPGVNLPSHKSDCHSERSEESLIMSGISGAMVEKLSEILRSAQDDSLF